MKTVSCEKRDRSRKSCVVRRVVPKECQRASVIAFDRFAQRFTTLIAGRDADATSGRYISWNGMTTGRQVYLKMILIRSAQCVRADLERYLQINRCFMFIASPVLSPSPHPSSDCVRYRNPRMRGRLGLEKSVAILQERAEAGKIRGWKTLALLPSSPPSSPPLQLLLQDWNRFGSFDSAI